MGPTTNNTKPAVVVVHQHHQAAPMQLQQPRTPVMVPIVAPVPLVLVGPQRAPPVVMRGPPPRRRARC
eukprot:scaffold179857_cov29-Prasinocladus_malaysianus.AAC.1